MRQIIKYVLVGILSVLIILLLFGPGLIKLYLNKNGEELTGRTLHIDKLGINFFTTTVHMVGFSMFELNDRDEFFGFDTLLVNVNPLRLLKKEIHLQQLLLANPYGTVIREDSSFNFSDLAETNTLANTNNESPNEEQSEKVAYHLNLNNLEMRNGNFSYVDRPVENTININSLSFNIPQIYWNAADSSNADLAFQLSQGGSFRSDINYDVETGNFSGYVDIEGVELKMILPYLKQAMNFSDVQGTYETKLNFSGSSTQLNSLSVSGYMAVNDLLLLDSEGDSIAGMQQNLIAIREVKPMQQKYIIDSIHIEKPFGTFEIMDSIQTNWSKLIVNYPPVNPDSTTEQSRVDSMEIEPKPVQNELLVQLGKLNVNNGVFIYKDHQLDTTFVFTVSQFKLGLDSIRLNERSMSLKTSMLLNHDATLESNISFNPYALMDSFLMEYALSGLSLSHFDLYTRKYIGYSMQNGKLFLTGNTSINDSILKSENKINIRSIAMGDKEGGEYDVPVKTALFLIKDNNDNVHLDLPIEGDLSDPNTSLGGLIAKKLTDFVFKIIKSPFKFVGSIIGIEAGEMTNIPFEYAETKRLNDTQKKSLDQAIKFAEKKPELNVELQYLNDRDLEAKVLAKEWSENEFRKKERKQASNFPSAYKQFLIENSGIRGGSIEQMERELAPKGKIIKEMEKREVQRIKMVKDYLKKHDKTSSIKLFEYDAENTANNESIPRLNARVGLK